MGANTLVELNNMLFEQINQLNTTNAKGDELKALVGKTKVLNEIAKTIVMNADVLLKAQVYEQEKLACCQALPEMLQIENSKKK